MSGEIPGCESVSLYRSTAEGNAVCWSRDDRIAVAATDAVYVLVRLLTYLTNAVKKKKNIF